MDGEEVFDFDPSGAPPMAALKLAINEFGPAVERFVAQLGQRHAIDEPLYEMILSNIAMALVEGTDIDFANDVSLF